MSQPEIIGTASTPEFSDDSETRLSCGAIARIEDEEGRFLLIFNKLGYLKPLGGAIKLAPGRKEEFLGQFGANFERQEEDTGMDLRFKIKKREINRFIEWLREGDGIEPDAIGREIREEVSSETGVLRLKGFIPEILEQERLGYHAAFDDPQKYSSHSGLRILEVWKVVLSENSMREIKRACAEEQCELRWVTPEEIESGFTEEGLKITRHTKALVNYQADIPLYLL